MARGAIARLYDVDEDALEFTKFRVAKRYDQGTIKFRARKGSLVNLQRMHESLWATRLSGGTRSGVICLEVTVAGEVVQSGGLTILKVSGSDRRFVLVAGVKAKPPDAKPSVFAALKKSLADGQNERRITGYVEDWVGRWPGVLSRKPAKQMRLMVTAFEPKALADQIVGPKTATKKDQDQPPNEQE